MDKIFEIVLLTGLGIISVYDIRSKKIPCVVLYILFIAGVTYVLICKNLSIQGFITIIPGIILLIISSVTKEQIGYGDSFLIMIMGLYLCLLDLVSVLMLSFALSATAAIILIVIFKKSRKYEIAFSPFLLISYAIVKGVSGICV